MVRKDEFDVTDRLIGDDFKFETASLGEADVTVVFADGHGAPVEVRREVTNFVETDHPWPWTCPDMIVTGQCLTGSDPVTEVAFGHDLGGEPFVTEREKGNFFGSFVGVADVHGDGLGDIAGHFSHNKDAVTTRKEPFRR